MKLIKSESTPLRPVGKRTINAPLVELDLLKYIRQIKEEKTWERRDRNTITVFKSETLRVLLIWLKKGARLKTHATSAVISIQVLKGDIHFITAEKETTLTKGNMVMLHANIPHKVEAETESFILLTLANVPKQL